MSRKQQIEDLYGITKKAYAKTIDQKVQLEFLMKKILDVLEEDAKIEEPTKENLNGSNS